MVRPGEPGRFTCIYYASRAAFLHHMDKLSCSIRMMLIDYSWWFVLGVVPTYLRFLQPYGAAAAYCSQREPATAPHCLPCAHSGSTLFAFCGFQFIITRRWFCRFARAVLILFFATSPITVVPYRDAFYYLLLCRHYLIPALCGQAGAFCALLYFPRTTLHFALCIFLILLGLFVCIL